MDTNYEKNNEIKYEISHPEGDIDEEKAERLGKMLGAPIHSYIEFAIVGGYYKCYVNYIESGFSFQSEGKLPDCFNKSLTKLYHRGIYIEKVKETQEEYLDDVIPYMLEHAYNDVQNLPQSPYNNIRVHAPFDIEKGHYDETKDIYCIVVYNA